jgi:hypothetical protein
MKKLLTAAFIVMALVTATAQLLSPVAVAAGGTGACPKTTPVRCLNCDGTFAYCARSHAFCPECAAP